MVLPKTAGQPGVVLELKTVEVDEGETPEAASCARRRRALPPI
jgi:hypothetical protein